MIRNLTKAMHTKFGKIVISAILGLGLASLFRRVCDKRNCLVFHAPPLAEINKNVYSHSGKCYTFAADSVQCNKDKQMVDFQPSSRNF